MDLSKLKLVELKSLLLEVGAEIEHRAQSDLEAARKEVAAIAQRAGVSLKDLVGTDLPKSKTKKQTGKIAAQYRNPSDPSQEWTGRGRQPRWVKELLASGKNIMIAKIGN